MVVYKECIKDVLSRIYLEGISYNGKPPQRYWEAKQALERLDKTCLTVNSSSDPNSPIGWRRNNCPILIVGKKNYRLKFAYTKQQLNNGEILVTVDEVADGNGNILTEKVNRVKGMKIRLSESELMQILSECTKRVLKEEIDKSIRDSYMAKPKGKGRLNDWEISNILRSVISKMVSNEQISMDDATMLLHYGLYNNDCYSHYSDTFHK